MFSRRISQTHVATRSWVVTLSGVVPTDAEREIAEFDAWYVFGVDDVRNELTVSPGAFAGAPPPVRSPGPAPLKGGLWRPRGTQPQ